MTRGASALDVYLKPADFISAAFEGDPPQSQKLWITGDLRNKAVEILGHAPPALRLSYWRRGGKTAWILDEIGKERPITAGFVIDNDRVASVKVLVYRESRGGEIRHPFFTDQFAGIMLDSDTLLDRKIDGISGATLSVNAIKKLTRLALLFNKQVTVGE